MLTFIIIGITVLISISCFNQPQLFEKAKFNPWSIAHRKEWWRWMTGGFVHADYFHLAVNMFTLYFFGSKLEGILTQFFGMNGIFIMALMYLAAIPVSSMRSYYKYKDNHNYSAVGASGAVCAILFSNILFDPMSKICPYYAICIPAWLFGILYLFYSHYMGKKQLDNIGHDEHFFGAIFGLVFTIIIKNDVLLLFVQNFTH